MPVREGLWPAFARSRARLRRGAHAWLADLRARAMQCGSRNPAAGKVDGDAIYVGLGLLIDADHRHRHGRAADLEHKVAITFTRLFEGVIAFQLTGRRDNRLVVDAASASHDERNLHRLAIERHPEIGRASCRE